MANVVFTGNKVPMIGYVIKQTPEREDVVALIQQPANG